MENILIYVVAVILAASITVAYMEREAAGVGRDDDPRGFWTLLSMGVGGLGALLVLGAVD